MLDSRVHVVREGDIEKGPVVYWMSRDQRAKDNWALLYAQEIAMDTKSPLAVAFCLVPSFLGATHRQYEFMLEGLERVAEFLKKKNIPFFLLTGEPSSEIPRFLEQHNAALLVTDFDPLRIKRKWKRDVSDTIAIPFHEVDTHNIVPCRVASSKQEYAARTIRPKIHRVLDDFLDTFPYLLKHPHSWSGNVTAIDWQKSRQGLKIDTGVKAVDWLPPGDRAAHRALRNFINGRLDTYDNDRNDPSLDGQSGLSPYLHFGQIAPQRVALEVQNSDASKKSREAYLEELIVRRELSDNFCFYQPHYDIFEGFPEWARKTLNQHRDDEREDVYTPDQFENADTHDPLWNAAQVEMVKRGKMHGYMRMYWAKKILEWTASPEDALEIAIYLNDRYELDGRDPNGYVGVMWSTGGVHDRAWQERAVFGKVRYMSYNGCKSKFDIQAYIHKVKEE